MVMLLLFVPLSMQRFSFAKRPAASPGADQAVLLQEKLLKMEADMRPSRQVHSSPSCCSKLCNDHLQRLCRLGPACAPLFSGRCTHFCAAYLAHCAA